MTDEKAFRIGHCWGSFCWPLALLMSQSPQVYGTFYAMGGIMVIGASSGACANATPR